jgi:hypothetical protein
MGNADWIGSSKIMKIRLCLIAVPLTAMSGGPERSEGVSAADLASVATPDRESL